MQSARLSNIRNLSSSIKSLSSLVGVSNQKCVLPVYRVKSPQNVTSINDTFKVDSKMSHDVPATSTTPLLDKLCANVAENTLNKVPLYCPTLEKPVKVYSFPTPDKVIMEAPTIISLIIEKVEPTKPVVSMLP